MCIQPLFSVEVHTCYLQSPVVIPDSFTLCAARAKLVQHGRSFHSRYVIAPLNDHTRCARITVLRHRHRLRHTNTDTGTDTDRNANRDTDANTDIRTPHHTAPHITPHYNTVHHIHTIHHNTLNYTQHALAHYTIHPSQSYHITTPHNTTHNTTLNITPFSLS